MEGLMMMVEVADLNFNCCVKEDSDCSENPL